MKSISKKQPRHIWSGSLPVIYNTMRFLYQLFHLIFDDVWIPRHFYDRRKIDGSSSPDRHRLRGPPSHRVTFLILTNKDANEH